MGQSQHRATEVAETLSRFIKADLAEDLSLDHDPPQISGPLP